MGSSQRGTILNYLSTAHYIFLHFICLQYGEKLVLLAEASTPIISALPSIPPSASQPYTGTNITAATRASLQQSLDNYKPGTLSHSFQPSIADLNRSDSRSFGITHASELSSISSPSLPAHTGHKVTNSESGPSPPLNPAVLNNTPTPIPVKASSNATASVPDQPTSASTNVATSPSLIAISAPQETKSAPLHVPEPTVAETGVPLSAGAGGPGPASGSLKDLKSSPVKSEPPVVEESVPTYSSGPSSVPIKLESAEEEKSRLQREERDRLLQSGGPPPTQKYETAEEEKKRLEKEEKERLLNEDASKLDGPSGKDNTDGDGATPPPYQDF